ncbi:Holo-[acyl-carrier protein] synthase [Fusobacterium vincentii ATCC 49256]|uniref:Holo-[acyl-carrier-protein] synthase n=1 Tax=Fusobacterium vincentii ATCC 49256 TaxID=209882 RepID=Q7P6R0_FUSVC|nr:holo-ACP synthase [Fusobacterium sp. HMSC064B12]EAA24492.1 Holo-[acyl-carrier protein] synthase [Fusobacterium vincentii ATCC 49256]OFL33671.1 4'-phosphopantetheinyl transferase [Fusobacterium sp. HMSC064B12]BEO94509.1 holo-ACP synthase [Fusobacterium nucleatum]BEP05041.1 holo-ACP synthase [Fusobacterium nucleatum]
MIVGIGNDIIEIERIEKAISKESFKNKVYTQRELENIEKRGDRVETYAGIFSAKEAISKAIGTGVREFSLTDLEILNDDLGKPYVVVSERLDKIIKSKKEDYQIEISISHSKKYAIAMAIIM